jgi:hypothetical protein
MELRQARAALARIGGGVAIAEAELESAIDTAKRHRDEAQARLASLEVEEERLKAEDHELDRRLEAKRKEERVLARGAELRDKDVDWLPPPQEVPRWLIAAEKALLNVAVGSAGLAGVLWLLLRATGRL